MNEPQIKRKLTVPALLIVGIILGLGLSLDLDRQSASLAEKSRVPMDTQKELNTISTALSQVAAAVSPSVVNVSTTKEITEDRPSENLYNHPFFRRFFGDPFSPENGEESYQKSSLGSGVIVSSNGHILTNNHVIEKAGQIEVTLHDQRTFEAKILGADPKTDLALLKVDAVDLPALVLDEDNNLQVGEIVVAVGIPFGLSHTVTMGIVSAIGRSNIGIVDYEDFIQTDAAINPGNSGGALVNSAGELIGINTAIFSTSGGNMGVGFAIPVQMAKSVMNSLLEHGRVLRGWLGVSIQPITPELAEYFTLDNGKGALVSQVVQGSPAEKAGFQEGDVIVAFNQEEIVNPTELKNKAGATQPGTTVTITVIRQSKREQMKVTLVEYPEDGEGMLTSMSDGKFFGAHLQNLSSELKKQLDIPQSLNGVLVVEVDPQSKAEGVLREDDVIIQANRQNINNSNELFEIMNSTRSGDSILLLTYRNGRSIYLTLAP